MKKIILSVAVVATAAIAGVNYLHSQKDVELTGLALENLEALARNEGDFGITCGSTSGTCWVRSGAICFVGAATYQACTFSGYTWTSCSSPCN